MATETFADPGRKMADLGRWFEDGVNAGDPVLVRVRASRAHCRDGEGDGEIVV